MENDSRTDLIVELPEALVGVLVAHDGIKDVFRQAAAAQRTTGINLIKAITAAIRYKVLAVDARNHVQVFVDVNRGMLIDELSNTIDGLTLARSRNAKGGKYESMGFITELISMESSLRGSFLVDLTGFTVKTSTWASNGVDRGNDKFIRSICSRALAAALERVAMDGSKRQI